MYDDLEPLSDEEKGKLHKRWHMILGYSGCFGEWEQVVELLNVFLEMRRSKEVGRP